MTPDLSQVKRAFILLKESIHHLECLSDDPGDTQGMLMTESFTSSVLICEILQLLHDVGEDYTSNDLGENF